MPCTTGIALHMSGMQDGTSITWSVEAGSEARGNKELGMSGMCGSVELGKGRIVQVLGIPI